MNKAIKISLITISLVVLAITTSIFLIQNYKLFSANKKAQKTIILGDNKNIIEMEQKEIFYDNVIGALTIPDILLENAPIKEGTELEILSTAIGHFTSTSVYAGNVGLASHNSADSGAYFENLNKLKEGSEIYYQTNFGARRYVVKTIVTIDETDFSYLQETGDNRITLITCVTNNPTKRLCVQAVETEENMINNQ